MNSTIMLNNLRTLLDEVAEGNWTDIECFQALSNGQTLIIDLAYKRYQITHKFSSIFNSLITSVSGDTDSSGLIALPSDFMGLLNAQLNSKACKIIQIDDKYYFREENIYLSSSSNEPTVIVQNTNLKFNVSAITPANYNYLKFPISIAAAVDPTIPSQYHPAIVIYAFAELLKKFERDRESIENFNQFIKMIQQI